MAYQVAGQAGGTPFVWGHGLTNSCALDDRFPLIDLGEISAAHRVVRYDARGHGESDELVDPKQGSWAELAKDQLALLDHLDIGDFALGGASMGVGTALHSALSLQKRLKRLVLVIPPTGWEVRAEQVAMYEQMASLVEARGVDALIAASAALPPPDPFVGRDDWTERRAASLGGTDPAWLAANLRGAGHADLPSPDQISTIGAPTLVLAWTGDPGHPASTAERLGSLLPTAEVVISSTYDEVGSWTARCLDFLGSS